MIQGCIRIGMSEQAQRVGDKSTTTLPAPLESKKGRKQTQNESFYPILLVGMNIFCIFAKVMTVTVITNTILDMKFYDRGNERQVLGEVLQQSRSEARMTVLMGRRRIGKTELSQRCGDDVQSIYQSSLLKFNLSWYSVKQPTEPVGGVCAVFLVLIGSVFVDAMLI